MVSSVKTESGSLPFSFEEMLARMLSRDRASDGLFLTGVLTTGIYCLPSCPARKPKAENVQFFASEEEAQGAGLRACRRCRPDDFLRGREPEQEQFLAVLGELGREPASFPDLESLGRRLGVGSSKLHRMTLRWAGATPSELLHRARVEAAMSLLAEGRFGATDVAFEVGYGSVSAFYKRFKAHTGQTPRAFRVASEP